VLETQEKKRKNEWEIKTNHLNLQISSGPVVLDRKPSHISKNATKHLQKSKVDSRFESTAEPPQVIYIHNQSIYVAKNMILLLSGKASLPYKRATPMMGIQIGKKAGVGYYGIWKLSGFVVAQSRKMLGVEKLQPTVDGSQY